MVMLGPMLPRALAPHAVAVSLLSGSLVGCAAESDAARRASTRDPRVLAIKADCARDTARSKTAAHDARVCVDARLDALSRAQVVEAPGAERARREAGCRLEAKPHVAQACLERLDAPRALDAGGALTPEERRERALAHCRTMGKLTFVQACEARVRAHGS